MLADAGPSVAQNLTQGRPAARQAAPADTAGFRASQLDATMATIAFHRLNGSMPDFNRQAGRGAAQIEPPETPGSDDLGRVSHPSGFSV
ncbi:hypothetical protein ACFQU7_01805 [Pseudoroseomonas wenyumeiae]